VSEHLPVLLVAVPLILAPIAALVGRGAWAVAWGACWWAFAVAIGLLRRVLAEGTISYHLGGWAPPIGIE